MWEDILKRRFNAKQDAEDLVDEDFLNGVAHQFLDVKEKIEELYYPYYDEDRKDRFDILRNKTYRFLLNRNYRKALKGAKGIKKMVNQFNLPALDYVIEMLEYRLEREE